MVCLSVGRRKGSWREREAAPGPETLDTGSFQENPAEKPRGQKGCRRDSQVVGRPPQELMGGVRVWVGEPPGTRCVVGYACCF